jgi:hypothetical protein
MAVSSNKTNKAIVLPRTVTSVVKSKTVESKVERGQAILNADKSWVTQDPRTLRSQGKVTEAIRTLAKENGNLSTALFDMVQIADSGWKVSAYVPGTTEFSGEGTILANNIVASMTTLYDYTLGFGKKRPITMLIQTLLRETAITGGCAMELELDKARLPERFQAVDYSTLEWVSDGKGSKYPQQVGFGDPIQLNIPTFYAESLHQEMDTAYSTSIFRSALDAVFTSADFMADMRRVVFKSGHSRLVAILDSDKIRASAPKDVRADDKKLMAYMTTVKTQVEDTLKDIAPEDAVVAFDSVNFETQDIGKNKADYSPMLTSLGNIESTSLKTPPSVLGMRAAGSQSLSNTETLIFLKTAKALQTTVESVMSRGLTTACRLYGSDVYVKFEFSAIDLRPESELEAFKTMKEARILQRLSLGLITDAQAAYELDLPYNPAAPTLSGTNFYSPAKADPETEGSDTTRGGAEDNLQPGSDVPRKGGGKSQ